MAKRSDSKAAARRAKVRAMASDAKCADKGWAVRRQGAAYTGRAYHGSKLAK